MLEKNAHAEGKRHLKFNANKCFDNYKFVMGGKTLKIIINYNYYFYKPEHRISQCRLTDLLHSPEQ